MDRTKSRESAGTLHVVGTPIGNLEDLSLRARKVLSSVALIAAEDTRAARVLLEHHGITTPVVSYHDHNETARTPQLIRRLLDGDDVALISEAGTPTISDPGYRLVAEAQRIGVRVVGVPGPSAVITALSVAGLPTDRFLFLGFLPARRHRRRGVLERVADEPGTLVVYESPRRILETLADIDAVLPGREVVVARELTKLHEETLRGNPGDVAERLRDAEPSRLRGEMTVLIRGAGHRRGPRRPHTTLEGARGVKQVARRVAAILGLPDREVYAALVAVRRRTTGGTDHVESAGSGETAEGARDQNVDVSETP